MKTTALTPVNLHIFSVNDAHAVITSTIGYAEPVKDQFDLLTLASFNDLKTNNEAMGGRMNLSAKNAGTANIDTEDLTRDGWWRESRSDVKTACNSMDSDRREAGLALKVFFTPYWNLDKESLPTETDLINEMMDKLEANAILIAHVATLGLAPKLENLKASNARLKELYNNRTSEQAASAGLPASSLKADAAVSYTQFCYFIEMANVLIPNNTIATLFNNIEQVRKKYVAIYKSSGNDGNDENGSSTDDTK